MDANRSLGLLATSSTGVTFFGLKLINNTNAAINTINLNFTAELWHQGAAKALNFGYFVDPTTTDSLPMTFTQIGSYAPTSGAVTTTVNTTGPLFSQAESFNNQALATTWAKGDALWLVWEEATATGSSQGSAIDNLTFSVVPEPSTWTWLAVAFVGLLALALRRVGGLAA